jgi:hypothetical protein
MLWNDTCPLGVLPAAKSKATSRKMWVGQKASSEGDLNARPIGLQPIALPLSYQNRSIREISDAGIMY